MFYRFPNGTFTAYKKVNGVITWQKWYAQFTASHQHSASGYRYRETEDITARKMQFAHLIANGIPPYSAYHQAKMPYVRSINVLKNKVRSLMMDRVVTAEISRSITPYLDKLKQDPAFSDEAMVDYVKDFMENVRKGSQTHLNSIIPMLTLLDKLPDYLKPKPKKAELVEAEYNIAPPEAP